MNMIVINCIGTILLSALGAGVAALVRDVLRERTAQLSHAAWKARHAMVVVKYNRDDYWVAKGPVTLVKRSDSAPRPSWLYDSSNRRMLRADEIKGL